MFHLTAIFDIRGLQNAAAPLMETCHWGVKPAPASAPKPRTYQDVLKEEWPKRGVTYWRCVQTALKTLNFYQGQPNGGLSQDFAKSIERYALSIQENCHVQLKDKPELFRNQTCETVRDEAADRALEQAGKQSNFPSECQPHLLN